MVSLPASCNTKGMKQGPIHDHETKAAFSRTSENAQVIGQRGTLQPEGSRKSTIQFSEELHDPKRGRGSAVIEQQGLSPDKSEKGSSQLILCQVCSSINAPSRGKKRGKIRQ